MKITNKLLVDDILPNLISIHELSLPKAKVKDLLTLAENLSKCETKAKDFWKARESLLQTFAEKDERGNKIEIENEKGQNSYKLSNSVKYGESFQELLDTKIEVKLGKVKSYIFDDVEGLKPIHIKGLMSILDK